MEFQYDQTEWERLLSKGFLKGHVAYSRDNGKDISMQVLKAGVDAEEVCKRLSALPHIVVQLGGEFSLTAFHLLIEGRVTANTSDFFYAEIYQLLKPT